MLAYKCMYMRALAYATQLGLACLLLLPSTGVFAAAFREQAVSYRVKGYEQQQQGDYLGASTWYQKAIALDSSYPTPHNDLGVVLELQGRMEEAEVAYEEALGLNPYYLEAHANLAMLYERMGGKEKGTYHWLKRYQLGDPGDAWTVRAEDRLVALGILKAHPGLGSRRYARRRIIEDALQLHEKSHEEFLAISEQYGDWP